MDRFRKQRAKLISRLSDDGRDHHIDDENDADGDKLIEHNADLLTPPIGGWQAESWKKRASEPTISYFTSSSSAFDSRQALSRHQSLEGSDVSKIRPTASRIASFDASSTPNPLGLTLVHSLPDPVLDLIFIHGLGGTSVGTWSWERDTSKFWPPWLGNDVELSKLRIFTYGYDAGLTGPFTTLNILDFAKDLLFRMKTYSGEDYEQRITIGAHPVILVVHSMGGLVAKKAYIIGKNDPQYTEMVSSISGMVYLATPHKGSQLAQTLNNILKATPTGSPKAYVAELEKNSSSLQDINEQFRNICGNLRLVSFYETLKTNIGGGIKRLIVEKDSALLEYPGETSCSLIADHHGIAKFKNPQDSNFINVRNVLRWLVREILGDTSSLDPFFHNHDLLPIQDLDISPDPPKEESSLKRLQKILGTSNTHEEDLEFFTERYMQGSCQWLLRRQTFQDWATSNPNVSNFLWVTGTPGSGKSTLASFVINLLGKRGHGGTCQHHFFSTRFQKTRTPSYFLRSIALQAAISSDLFCIRLLDLHESTGIFFEQQKLSTIWEKLFEGLLFRMPSQETFFWVIDGLDEAESPSELIKLISKIKSAARINILLISRATKDLTKDVSDLLPTIIHERIDAVDTHRDIQDYVRQSVHRILPSDDAQEEIVHAIMSKASGSFLWVKLALDRIKDSWYTKDDIKTALNELPVGMESLYERMISMISQQPDKIKMMARRILTWATCASSPLDVSELEMVLRPEFKNFVNLGRMAEEICGQFVVVNKSRVTLIHETARHFLLHQTTNLEISIPEHECHQHAASVCMDFLADSLTWRRVFTSIQVSHQSGASMPGRTIFNDYPFVLYALSFWAYHVSLASTDSDDFLAKVLGFLEEHCLLWINGVVLTRDFRILTRAAQNLKTYVRRRTQRASKRPPASLAMARDGELRQWANDIIRVVSRFGTSIAESPTSIYKQVVPFCPKDTIIAQTFASLDRSGFSVKGLSSRNWDDCLARLSLGDEQIAAQILCKDTFFVTLLPVGGTMVVWRAETCEEIRRITHGEYVTQMASSRTSNLIATAGFKSTKIWDITTGAELYNLPKERHHHTKAVAFGKNDDEIFIAYDDCTVQYIDLKTGEENWRFVAKEPNSQDFSCARHMSFSPDRSQISIIFRGRPAVVWRIQKPSSAYVPPKRCVLAEDRLRSAAEGDAWNAPEFALWHPVTDRLLILYEDTKIVEWNVVDDDQLVYGHTAARSMTLSEDGSFLLTSDVNGTLSIWVVPEYRLLYRMKYDELVTDLAFSPDGTRFYDLRGSFCNIWEPEMLVRAEEIDQDDMSSTYETITSEPVLANDDNSRIPITSLAHDSHDKVYCVGKEDGSVTMYSMSSGEKVRKLISHSSSVSVIKLAWSTSEKYLASVDDSGRVIVKRLEAPTADKDRWAVFPVCDIRTENSDAVEHIVFSAGEDYMLIASSTFGRVVSMKTKKEVCRMTGEFRGGTWLNHPKTHSILVYINGSRERHYLWKTLELKCEAEAPELAALGFSSQHTIIDQAIQVREQWLILDIVESGIQTHQGSRARIIELLDLFKLQSASEPPRSGARGYLIEGLAGHVRQLIGCHQDRIVFLDHQFWLCTWEMEPIYSKHKRHFFLPKDWVSPTALKMISLTRKGALLCPRNGEVAVVKSGFR